jgi:hypothetical protein
VNSSAITVTVADDNDASAWDLHVGSSEKSEVYHLFGWKQHFESVFGHDCYYLAARDDQGQTVGVLPLVHQSSRLFGNFLISVPCFNYCGILADTDQAHLALVEGATKLARELGAGHVELRHREGTALELPLRSDKVSMQLSLPDSEERNCLMISTVFFPTTCVILARRFFPNECSRIFSRGSPIEREFSLCE